MSSVPTQDSPTQNVKVSTDTWRANQTLSRLLRTAVFMIPLLAAWITVALVAPSLYQPNASWGIVIWALQALIIGSIVAAVVDQLSRRLLPLSALYGLSLVFPDEAPSRFGLALRLCSTKKLRQNFEEISTGDDFEPQAPQLAAERALALVGLLGKHDRATRGHSERVRAYVDLIAEEMGLEDEDRVRLSWAALLHDVGKLKVDPAILNSKTKPTTQQWESLKEHPGHSADLMRSLYEWLGDSFGAATEHHERWDGTGYPLQLEGDEISLAGRITAVADAFDTMTSVRSYKRAHSADSARRELVDCSGTQFDPDVVRAFLNVSLGRRWAAGPLSWIAEIPGIAPNSLGAVPAVIASVVIAAAALFGAIDPNESEGPPAGLASVSTDSQDSEFDDNPTPLTTVAPTTLAPPTTVAPSTTVDAGTSQTAKNTDPTTQTTVAGAILYPVAGNDSYDVATGDWLVMDVLGNDDEGDAIWDRDTLDFYIEPEQAKVVDVSEDGSLRYRSVAGYQGTDTFKYVVCNTNGHCAIGTVTIDIG